MNPERNFLEKTLTRLIECSQHLSIPRFSEFDPRKKVHQLTEFLRQKNYGACHRILDALRKETIPAFRKTEENKDNLAFYIEEKEELLKAALAWIKSGGDELQKEAFFDCKSEFFCCFLYLKISAIMDCVERTGQITNKLKRIIDEYEEAIEMQEAFPEDEFDEGIKKDENCAIFLLMLQTLQEQSNGKVFIIASYETAADFNALRADFGAAGKSQADAEAFIQATVKIMGDMDIAVERKTLATSDYLRWLAANKRKNDAQSRAAFLVTPTTLPMEVTPNNGWTMFPRYI